VYLRGCRGVGGSVGVFIKREFVFLYYIFQADGDSRMKMFNGENYPAYLE